jgi:hypothetical protein
MVPLRATAVGAAVLSAQMAIGADFTSFHFPADPDASTWYSGFTDRFFSDRINVTDKFAIYAVEYVALSDSWLNDPGRRGNSHLAVLRTWLLNAQVGPEGYVATQQHPSSAHDEGWPFPVWPQVFGPEGYKPGVSAHRGVTAGWHFYEEPAGWEIVIREVNRHRQNYPGVMGAEAAGAWRLDRMESRGLDASRRVWNLDATGTLPAMTSPEGVELDPFNCPYIQIRWDCTGSSDPERIPYMEWLREGDADWSEARRMFFYPDRTRISQATGLNHSILPLWRHPEWTGKIVRIRFAFPQCEPDQTLSVNSIFTHWDSRHLVNNALYVKGAWEYFRWTGDLGFLREMLPRLRTAIRYMMEEGHALELNHIRCTWPGHDGRPGFDVGADGSKTAMYPGRGKGGNYWDLLPLGWDDMYSTIHYFAALLAMAQIEEAAATHPGWAMPEGFSALDPAFLRSHAADVRRTANEKFWNSKTGRFVGTIDADGTAHDYGFTFINLEAIHYGIATEEHARQIMDWIEGRRIVESDTSRGGDIYAFGLAPRTTTRRNVEWYTFSWASPELIPFGGQVQDGGAVLGFSFYDIMSRIKTLGADNAWKRLMEIREWDEEVQKYGGYRKYYGDGKGGTTLQGGGTAGGIGIDFEFVESSMLSAVVPLGFMGLRPDGAVLHIEPKLPEACPEMAVRNLRYRGTPMDVAVSAGRAEVVVKEAPPFALTFRFMGRSYMIDSVGRHVLDPP